MTPAPIVLVVDRSDEALKLLKEERAATMYEFLHAKDGYEALPVVNDQDSFIAVAVIELELAGINGLDLLARLTSKQPKPKKIIATTSLDDKLLFELAEHMGADAVVRKMHPKEAWIGKVKQMMLQAIVDVQPGTEQS